MKDSLAISNTGPPIIKFWLTVINRSLFFNVMVDIMILLINLIHFKWLKSIFFLKYTENCHYMTLCDMHTIKDFTKITFNIEL